MSSLIGDIRKYAYNPTGIQRAVFNALDAILDGQLDVVDASNPFVYSLSATAACTAAYLQEAEVRTRKQYPSTAQQMSDLYMHMSDLDYADRFAVPATTTVHIVLQKTPLLESMVYEPATGNSVMVIPRNTQFDVNNTSLSLQYPVEIRQLNHGGLQITYLSDKPSPIKRLNTNAVVWKEFTDTNFIEWVMLDVEVDQFFINSTYQDISTSAGLVTMVGTTQQFYHIRCYLQHPTTKQWTEIKTTHSDQIYDPFSVTALIQVLNSQVKVTIPVIYASSALASGKLRIDVYETKGAIQLPLDKYTPAEWNVKWLNVDSNDDNEVTTAISQVNNLLYYSTSVLDGGRDALTFAQLKDRLINNAVGPQIVPITTSQLLSTMQDLGYGIVKHIDSLTDRVFLATRPLPAPSNAAILTPVNSAVLTVSASMVSAPTWLGAYSNADSVTLTDQALYQYVNGVTTPVSTTVYSGLLAQPLAQRCNSVSEGGYYYSPFTYVLDASNEVFESRAYYLQAPDVISRDFIDVNETLTLQASMSSAYSLVRRGSVYTLYITTASGDDYKNLSDTEVGAILSTVAPNQATRVSIQGILHHVDPATKERTWKFELTTNYYIDALDQMEFPSIQGTGNGLVVKLGLDQVMDLLLVSFSAPPVGYSGIDADYYIDHDLYPTAVPRVISHESVTLRFGVPVKTLWNQCRSAVGAVTYQTYTQNVPAYYTEDVYAVDPRTGAEFSVVNGVLTYNRLHKKGDPKLDQNGQPIYRHRVGELILDINGNPMPVPGYKRYMDRYVDITMISGVYYFSTDSNTQEYLKALQTQLLEWLTQDIPQYQSFLLEQTRIYYHPKTNAGTVKVLDSSNKETYIRAEQSLSLKLYVPTKVYTDSALRKALAKTSILALQSLLSQSVVAVSAIESSLKALYNNDVIDVEVTGLGGGTTDHTVLTILDEQTNLTLGKRLVALGDNTLLVEEDVDIQFIQHGYTTR